MNNEERIQEVLDVLYNKKSEHKGIYCFGDAGNSKSYTTLKWLREHKVKFELVTSKITNLRLFATLYKHRNKTLVFDDVYFENALSVDLLKGALGQEGKVCWNSSTSLKGDGVPSSFKFNGKIIIITNKEPKNNKYFYPLVSRVHLLETNLTIGEYKFIAKKICLERGVDFKLVEPHISLFMSHRDLRIITKACDYLLSNKQDIDFMFEIDKELEYLDKLHKKKYERADIKQFWMQEFDKSKRTFYRKLKEYNKRIKEN